MSPRAEVSDDAEPQVRAAGGVVWRVDDGALSVLLVHRPKYGDWTFPKGKLEPGEADDQAAHREVAEETGFDCVLGRELPSVRYLDHKGRAKVVRYWEMTVASGEFTPNNEVDGVDWLDVGDADDRLSYEHDRGVLAAFVEFATPPEGA